MAWMLRNRGVLSASLLASGSGVVLGSRLTANEQETKKKSKVVIVGGGAAGVSVSSFLCHDPTLNVVVIEPSPSHYYQPVNNKTPKNSH